MEKQQFLKMFAECLQDKTIEIQDEVIPSPYRDDNSIQVKICICVEIEGQNNIWYNSVVSE